MTDNSPWWRRHVGLAALLVVASFLRFQGINWDQGTHLHPDERFLTMVAADVGRPQSVSQYFDTSTSPLNPANVGHGFFVYGTFPLFIVTTLGHLTGMSGYDGIHLVGRAASGLFDLGTIVLTYALALMLVGPAAALAAAALMTFSVVSIQNAHFFTVDSFATCLTTASLYCLARIGTGGRWQWHGFFGIAFGLTLACRINLLLLAAIYSVVSVVATRSSRQSVAALFGNTALAALTTAATFRIVQPYAFAGPGLFDLRFASSFTASLRTIGNLVSGQIEYPPSVQWIGRTPIVFAGMNLWRWGLGPLWGLATVFAVPWCLFREAGDARHRTLRLLCLWVPLLFVFHASQFAATLRYFMPLVPLCAVVVAACLTATRARPTALIVVIAGTAAWALAFTAIYRQPNTRVEASRWILANVPRTMTLANEHWDDGLPLPLADPRAGEYPKRELRLYDDEDDSKRRALIATLDASDVLIISSNRLYGSIPRTPWRYPLGRRYYELLFGGQLGFSLERAFSSHPHLGPFVIDDDDAEEAFTVFDHPKVLLFRKTAAYSKARVEELLGAVSFDGLIRVSPREASALYRHARPSALRPPDRPPTEARTSAPTPGSVVSTIRWFGALQLLSLASFTILAVMLPASADRGYALGKLMAWLGPGTVVWLAVSTGLAPNTRAVALTAAALWLAAGSLIAWLSRSALRRIVTEKRRTLLQIEAVFSASFALFLVIRAFNPAIFWGEKPMDFAILNALSRAASFPPADPWFAGAPLNYFYFGHALTSIFATIAGVAPAFAFNLAVPTVGALLAVGLCAVGQEVTGRIGVGVWTAVLAVVAGNLAGPRAWLSHNSTTLGFDYFWSTSRVIAGTINEFPFWNLTFADLHAHVLAMPLYAAAILVGCVWQTTEREDVTRLQKFFLGFLAAWILGAVAATSAWSVPPLAGLLFGFRLTAMGTGLSQPRRWVTGIAAWLALVGLSVLIFWPFWKGYTPAGMVLGPLRGDAAPLVAVGTIFGIFLVLAVPELAISAVRWTAGSRWRRLALVIPPATALVLGVERSTAAGLYGGLAMLATLSWFGDERPMVRIGALLVACAGILGVMTEFVFVWDRMNTVFRYYLDMWLLLGAAAPMLAYSFWTAARPQWRIRGVALATVLTCAGLFTSATGLIGFVREPHARSHTPTLDGLDYLRAQSPDEWQALTWMNREVHGIPVVLEAQGPPYQAFGRVSMNTGLPTVLGWQYHLFQQGRSRQQLDVRAADVRRLYEARTPTEIDRLLSAYHIDFVFVGPLERQTYGTVALARLLTAPQFETVFRNDTVTVLARTGQADRVKSWIVPVTPRFAEVDLSAPPREPRGVAVAADGTVALADFGNRRVLRLNADLTPASAFGRQGDGAAEFKDPCGIAVDTAGNIWVADTWNHRVQKLTPDGQLLSEIRSGFYGPRGIVVSGDMTAYVTDTGNGRVLRLRTDTEPQVVVDKGILDNPIGIGLSRSGDIVVADEGHRRIAVFSQAGELLRTWPVAWAPGSRNEPYLAVGPDDVVWVTDPAGRQVRLYDLNGVPLGLATTDAPLGLPLGIAVLDRRRAVVVDALSGRVVEARRSQSSGQGRAARGTVLKGTRVQMPTRKSPAR